MTYLAGGDRRPVRWPPPAGPVVARAPKPPADPARPVFLVGVDLGQADDFSAIAILRSRGHRHALLGLERCRGRSYVAVVELLRAVLADLVTVGTVYVVVDVVGIGRAVVDLMRARGIAYCGVAVHGGSGVRRLKDGTWSIPKRDIVQGLVISFEQRRISIPATLPLGDVLERELAAYAVKISPNGHDSYNAAGSEHDDLISALSLAVWHAERLARPAGKPVVGGRRSGPLQQHADRLRQDLAAYPHPHSFLPLAARADRAARLARLGLRWG